MPKIAEASRPKECPVCHSLTCAFWGKVGVYTIFRCKDCGHGITYPVPTSDELERLNSELYTLEQRVQTYLPKMHYFEKRYRKTLNSIKKLKSGGRLLDVGCNIGMFLKVAREEGFDVAGVELNQDCAEFGSRHFSVPIYSDYLENIAKELGTFDVVTLFDVLEHIPDMTGFVNSVKSVLNEDGLLVIQLPNFGSLMAELTGSQWKWLTPPDHLHHFTPHSLQLFLELHGFKVSMLRTWEPCNEFIGNLFSCHRPNWAISRFFLKLIRELKILVIPVLILQKFWWSRNRGGLIEIHAVKNLKLKQI